MSIEIKVAAVEKLYKKLDAEINTFQAETKLHCNAGCGKCCTKPDIEASPLEFLPWAFHLFLSGEAEKVLEELNKRQNPICLNYNPLSLIDKVNGRCSSYEHRGLICRLFGYAATTDKYGQLRLATCSIIKTEQQKSFDKSSELIKKGLTVPIFTDYYMNLSQIDFRLGNLILPVNKALKFAIEEVLQYYAYRPLPLGHINIA
jgi:uncharacterized protein